jgi:mannose-6-phosphate isomerase-like protein (cupin superfamily)
MHLLDARRGCLLVAVLAVTTLPFYYSRRVVAAPAEPSAAPVAAASAQVFALSKLLAERQKSGRSWLEFLRVPSLSAGVYSLPKGATDPQTPHQQDEVYHVLGGKAVLTVEGRDYPVEGGSVVFVAARAPHRFRDITEDLTALVFFAPAETE